MGATTLGTTALSLMTLCVIINDTQHRDSHYNDTDSIRILGLTTKLTTTISITTPSILTVSKTLLSVKTLSLITLSITKLSITTHNNTLRITTFSRTIKIS